MNPKVLPTPTSLSTQIRPPCSSTIRFDSVRPSRCPRLRRRPAALLEGLEDALLVGGGDADAGVGDGDDELAAVPAGRTVTRPRRR